MQNEIIQKNDNCISKYIFFFLNYREIRLRRKIIKAW